MSSLWTPGGEHPVSDQPSTGAGTDANGAPGAQDRADDVDEESYAALRQELDEARRRLAEVPAASVIANHALGFYELAAIHLMQSPPKLSEASLAIDAMGAIVEGLAGRLGDSEPTLKEGLANIRLAFVQVKSKQG